MMEDQLKTALKNDDVTQLKELLNQGLDLNTTDVDIADFIRVYGAELISEYLRKERKCQLEHKLGYESLYYRFSWACRGDLDEVKGFLEAGFDGHKYNTLYFNEAILSDQIQIAEYLIQQGSRYFANCKKADDSSYYILHQYIFDLFEPNIDMERHEEFAEQAEKAQEMLLFLLRYGYDINKIDAKFYRGTPLDQCLKNVGLVPELIPFMCVLREHGAKTFREIEVADKQSSFLLRACYQGDLHAVQSILETDFIFHRLNAKYFNFAIFFSARDDDSAHLQIAELLLKNGASCFRNDRQSVSTYILHYYIAHLCSPYHPPNPNVLNLKAVKKTILFLIEQGCSINAQEDLEGCTPRDVLFHYGRGLSDPMPLALFLREQGAKTAKELGYQKSFIKTIASQLSEFKRQAL